MHIIFQLISFQLVFIQAWASFYLVFHKGGENSYFFFQLVFCLPLVLYSTPILYDEKWLKNEYWFLIWYQERIGNQVYLYIFQFGIKILIGFFETCFQCLIYLQLAFLKIFMFTFNWYHDSLILIFFFNWYHVGRICFIVYLDPFIDDWQKGGEVFSIWVYMHDFSMHDFYLFIYKKAYCFCFIDIKNFYILIIF